MGRIDGAPSANDDQAITDTKNDLGHGLLGSEKCQITPRQTGTEVDQTVGGGETWVWIIAIPVERYPAGDGDIGNQMNTS
jgi:hypothetical protein